MTTKRLAVQTCVLMLVASVLAFHFVLRGTGVAVEDEEKTGLMAARGATERMAPDFELQDLEGNTVKLSGLREEKAVLLYFWATWCPHCISAKPKLAKLRREVSENDLEILGINVGSGDSLERVKRFQKGHPATWPILYDTDSKVSRAYGVQGIPLFVIVDQKGREVYRGNDFPEAPLEYLRQ